MKYSEYLSSAKRHDYTCSILKDKLEEECLSENSIEFSYLYSNLFYISGYIFECVIKYKILEFSEHDELADVDKNSCSNFDFNFKKDFRIHNLAKLLELLDVVSGGNGYSVNDSVIDLVNSWNPNVRYEDFTCSVNDVISFYMESKRILNRM